MDATAFELTVSLPPEIRYAVVMRDLAIHAARFAGCAGPDADAFGTAVEAVMMMCLDAKPGAGPLPIVVRRRGGPVEFLVACERRFEGVPLRDAHITIGWTTEAGRDMCRIARSMPAET